MYGVVEIAGHQYKVKAGDLIDVEKLNAEEGKTLEFDQVFFVGGDQPQVGMPTVKGAKVKAQVLRQGKSRKILVFKRRPGLYQKKRGHRQNFTALFITEVDNGSGKVEKAKAPAKKTEK